MVEIPRWIVWKTLWNILVDLGPLFLLKIPKGALTFFVETLGIYLDVAFRLLIGFIGFTLVSYVWFVFVCMMYWSKSFVFIFFCVLLCYSLLFVVIIFFFCTLRTASSLHYTFIHHNVNWCNSLFKNRYKVSNHRRVHLLPVQHDLCFFKVPLWPFCIPSIINTNKISKHVKAYCQIIFFSFHVLITVLLAIHNIKVAILNIVKTFK